MRVRRAVPRGQRQGSRPQRTRCEASAKEAHENGRSVSERRPARDRGARDGERALILGESSLFRRPGRTFTVRVIYTIHRRPLARLASSPAAAAAPATSTSERVCTRGLRGETASANTRRHGRNVRRRQTRFLQQGVPSTLPVPRGWRLAGGLYNPLLAAKADTQHRLPCATKRSHS